MSNVYKVFVVAALLLSAFFGCDGLEDYNINEKEISDDQLVADFQIAGSKFKPIFQNIYQFDPAWSFQLQQNLNADIFSGYMTNPRPFVAGQNNTTYNLVSGWNNYIWSVPYEGVMNWVNKIKKISNDYPTMYGAALILKVSAMHRVSDVFGPIVYRNFGDFEKAGVYDSQEEAYNAFFVDLDQATANIMEDLNSIRFKKFDMVYGGNYTNWIKLANSIRLRLAIRIAKVAPMKAKEEGEKALNHPLGVLESNEVNFTIKGNIAHPLSVIDNAWGDIRMNASMESILLGYKDPRALKYFTESTGGDLKGIRNGLSLMAGYSDEEKQKTAYLGFSALNDAIHTTNVQLMTAAEVAFLKAEASLRGWSGAGDARSNYEQGINLSFNQHGAEGVTTYLADNTSRPKDYEDPLNSGNSIAAMSDITIAWNESSTNEEKLERIITQKWIAMFPEGQEAWSEYRRTGYPKIFPVVSNQSGGTIDTNIQIRRIPFVDSEISTNRINVQKAKTLLKGPDNGGTRLWWDTGNINF
ncbi:MAG TPA: SusD/RagB family nutrient-binding outer membrane lipoprotein [Tenacibaculum sp.]|nr:SusD/RagB family nutrient-binding outer membrane lipoprotein [Tenacibaculum sp.]HBI40475.1 SusD/RagB family nutrient-binding outer membrane lipoprotein [Tenacibaculum sp.]